MIDPRLKPFCKSRHTSRKTIGACDEELDEDQQADDEADHAGVAVYARHDYGLLDSNNHAGTVINKNKNDVNSWFSRVVWRPPFSPGIVTKRKSTSSNVSYYLLCILSITKCNKRRYCSRLVKVVFILVCRTAGRSPFYRLVKRAKTKWVTFKLARFKMQNKRRYCLCC